MWLCMKPCVWLFLTKESNNMNCLWKGRKEVNLRVAIYILPGNLRKMRAAVCVWLILSSWLFLCHTLYWPGYALDVFVNFQHFAGWSLLCIIISYVHDYSFWSKLEECIWRFVGSQIITNLLFTTGSKFLHLDFIIRLNYDLWLSYI